MEAIFRRVFMLLLGVTLGYLAGFNDGSMHDHMVVTRAVQHLQSFAQQAVSRRQADQERVLQEP